MKRGGLFLVIFILAFCSIVYELILAQTLSAFLENTVLRYSITIGLYMFSLGVGSLCAEGKFVRRPVLALLILEILLTLIGGFSVIVLHLIDALDLSRLVFSGCSHILIVLIGILSGMEIPLLIHIANYSKKGSENLVLGINYGGAFFGAIIFAFVFYPSIGLIPAAFLAGSLNAVAGIFLFSQKYQLSDEQRKKFGLFMIVLIVIFIGLLLCLFYSEAISQYFSQIYLRG